MPRSGHPDSQVWLWKEKKGKEGEAAIGAERVCSLTLKAGSICLDISERVLGAIKQSQNIGHQHGGSLSHSPRDLSPPQGHTSGPNQSVLPAATPGSLSLYVTALVTCVAEGSYVVSLDRRPWELWPRLS